MLDAVAVSWSAAERYATSAEVIWLVVLVRARPVGQQRARDGGLLVSQQRVHL